MSRDQNLPSNPFDRPVPREPKPQNRAAQIQAQNRRREYLVRNPSYFDNLENELVEPVLYERLIKRFHSAAEREADGKAKGYGRTLEAALQRGESKLAHLHQIDGPEEKTERNSRATTTRDTGLENPWDQEAENKEHGSQLWREFLEDRFVHGRDEDFEYDAIDGNDEYDTLSRNDAEDAWFDQEEPSWADDGQNTDEHKKARKLEGETGIQDF
ncbi:coiled-coil domain-containing protein-domain-containing protein [Mariannaea sp. PMI_226]|nr:coiled-coil domain-containing protein-domain-containing protein [Mariannaea sp. PMI_226]